MKDMKKYINYLVYAILFAFTIILVLLGSNSSPLFHGIVNRDSAVFQIMAERVAK